jgi:hypothetical protein
MESLAFLPHRSIIGFKYKVCKIEMSMKYLLPFNHTITSPL